MEGKKRYLALVLFLAMGMITYTYANPIDSLEENDKSNAAFTDYSKTELRKTEAEKAVEKVEVEPTQENVENALTVIEETVTNEEVRQNLNQRVEQAEQAIDVAALISNVEKMINTAKTEQDIESSKVYFTNNNIEQVANDMNDGTVKENVLKRITYINEVFLDTEIPEITGIENNATTKDNVKITIKDKVKYEVEVTLNNEKTDFAEEFNKEGIYVVNVEDDAINKNTLTFTIDKTKPKFENIKSGNHVKSYTINLTDLTETTITLQKDHGEFTEIQNGYNITEEGTYQLVAVDEAGNKTTLWFAIDKTKPAISTTDKSYINYTKWTEVTDKFLTNVTITQVTLDGKEIVNKFTRDDFEVGPRNENFKLRYKLKEEGTYTIVAKDKYGNTKTETVTVDKTKPVISFNENATDNKIYLEKGTDISTVDVTAKSTDKVDGEQQLAPYKVEFKHAHDNETLDGENKELSSAQEGIYTYYYKVTDRAKNTTEKKLQVVVQDTKELKVLSNTVNYDEKTGTAIAVIVTNKDLNSVTNGWTQGLSKLNVITKKFYVNAKEDVKVKDLSGNELTIKVEVTELSELHTKDEVVLKEDTTLEKILTISENKHKVIDLNNQELLVKNPENNKEALINNNGTLTIKNGTLSNLDASVLGIIANESTGNLILENVKFKDNGSNSGDTIVNKGGKITITNCEFNQTPTTTTNSKRYANAAIYHESGELIVKNTKIDGKSDVAYAMGIDAGTVLLEDVSITHTRGGLSIYGGNVTINNANIVIKEGANGFYALYVPNVADSNITINGGKYDGHRAALYLQGANGYNGKINVEVNDGVFSHKHTKKSYSALIVSKAQEAQEINLTIKGGTFKKKDVTSYLSEGYRQDLSNWKVTETSKIEDVKYLKEVITKGGTYTLEKDIELKDETLKIAKDINLTINTNGKTITGASSKSTTASLFKVDKGGSLTLTGNGTITFRAYAPDTNWDPEGFPTYASNTIANNGTLVIDGPTLINTTPKGGASYVIDNYAGGNLTVNNGIIKQTGGDMGIRLNTASAGEENANNVTINNGTISGYRAFWIHLAGSNTSVAPIVNLTINNGTFETTQENGFALYSYSYGNSFANTTATFNGGTFNGWVAFGGGENKIQETVTVKDAIFNPGIGRYTPDGWVSITK